MAACGSRQGSGVALGLQRLPRLVPLLVLGLEAGRGVHRPVAPGAVRDGAARHAEDWLCGGGGWRGWRVHGPLTNLEWTGGGWLGWHCGGGAGPMGCNRKGLEEKARDLGRWATLQHHFWHDRQLSTLNFDLHRWPVFCRCWTQPTQMDVEKRGVVAQVKMLNTDWCRLRACVAVGRQTSLISHAPRPTIIQHHSASPSIATSPNIL